MVYSQRKGCCAQTCGCISSTLSFVVVSYLLWHFLGRPSAQDARDFIGNIDFGDFTDVLGNLTDADWMNGFNEDPYVGDDTANTWRTEGYGLTLELQNALDDMWQTEFEVAVEDWQESEVLTLTTSSVTVDHTCTQVRGVMKVCNGNYGNTGWLGINEIITESRGDGPMWIVSSVAKMNEHYLLNAPYEKRQYTMCHEIGHGFGLPHTDENPYNSDQGNCLDYTNTPENNMHPGEVNFERLKTEYIREYQSDEGYDNRRLGNEVRQEIHTYYLWDY